MRFSFSFPSTLTHTALQRIGRAVGVGAAFSAILVLVAAAVIALIGPWGLVLVGAPIFVVISPILDPLFPQFRFSSFYPLVQLALFGFFIGFVSRLVLGKNYLIALIGIGLLLFSCVFGFVALILILGIGP